MSAPLPPRPAPAASLVLALFGLIAFAPPAHCGGYLWLGAEYFGEGNIYRYNIATNSIDRVVAHAGSDHWNNAAVHESHLYIGHPTSDTMHRLDGYTGDMVLPGSYSPSLSGHKEDGASFEGSLWRMTYSGGALHRMNTSGVRETTFAVQSGLVGLEFVGTQGYATNYSAGTIGRLTRGASTWTYTPAVWAPGFEPEGSVGALAYDTESQTLYMTTREPNLYTVTVVNDTARATLVVELESVGYPMGGLPDGMGWIPPDPILGVDPSRLPQEGTIELGPAVPNPAHHGVTIEVRLARPGAARVGIYDPAGRRMRAWEFPQLAAGVSRFHWDLRSPGGGRVPPGQYRLRLEADGEQAVRAFSVIE